MAGMPSDLVLVRHGESEGNVALGASKKGDDNYFEIPGFRERSGHDWRLTDKGIWQGQLAGERLRSEGLSSFERYYVSDFARAKETAHYLQLPSARWFINIYLHEQLWGDMDVMPRSELSARSPDAQAKRNRHRFYGAYNNGEDMGEVCLRLDRILETLGRECTGKRVILVCHGNVIWGFRMLIERITPRQYHLLDTSNAPADRIDNGQIYHYRSTGGPSFTQVRTLRPASKVTIDESWRDIVRPSFTNDELLTELEHIPQLINE